MTVMPKSLVKIVSVIFISGFCILPANAHHSFIAQYDSNIIVDIQGYVTKIEWFNPHVYFYLDVENETTGELESWAIEMGPPHSLQGRGWKRNTLTIGDEIHVAGTGARDGSTTANARTVTMVSTGDILGAASSEKDGK